MLVVKNFDLAGVRILPVTLLDYQRVAFGLANHRNRLGRCDQDAKLPIIQLTSSGVDDRYPIITSL